MVLPGLPFRARLSSWTNAKTDPVHSSPFPSQWTSGRANALGVEFRKDLERAGWTPLAPLRLYLRGACRGEEGRDPVEAAVIQLLPFAFDGPTARGGRRSCLRTSARQLHPRTRR